MRGRGECGLGRKFGRVEGGEGVREGYGEIKMMGEVSIMEFEEKKNKKKKASSSLLHILNSCASI